MREDAKERIDDFCRRLEALLQESPLAGLRTMARDMAQDGGDNARALAEVVLAKMNVVSREEFEEQNRILADAVEKLAQIEARLEGAGGAVKPGGAAKAGATAKGGKASKLPAGRKKTG